jgi:hypothetical protein
MKRDKIIELLDLEDEEIKSLYNGWDKGDCSVIGLCEILLHQEMKKHKKENGEWYDRDIYEIKLRIK